MAMRPYRDKLERRDYFGQGFRLGLVFGVLGALIALARGKS